jgi:alkanesulfonate monooxygenase SsuD/methylene tetrahydromethanopterin reductase-like flavin-dependent oxidoreductase (luciferase family)
VTHLGAVFLPSNPPETLLDAARAADQAGLEQLWLWEDSFLNSGIAAAAAALGATTTLKVGIGIMPVPFRNVASMAMELATLHRIFGERILPGIGHGVQEWMGQVGARAASPMTLLREYAAALRSLLDGEEVTTGGRYVTLDRVKLDWPPSTRARFFVGATKSKTFRLSGELADGTVLTGGTPAARVREALAEIAPAGPHELIVYLPVARGADAPARLAAEQGKYRAEWPGVAGEAPAVAEAVREFAAAGATSVILQPTADEPDPVGFLRFTAQEVQPLLA